MKHHSLTFLVSLAICELRQVAKRCVKAVIEADQLDMGKEARDGFVGARNPARKITLMINRKSE